MPRLPENAFISSQGSCRSMRCETCLSGWLARSDFQPTVQVLNITVAALMTTDWIARRLEVPEGTDRVVIPGLCKGDMTSLEQKAGVPVERGPEDCRRLDEWFGQKRQDLDDYGEHDIELIAEINHANRFSHQELFAESTRLRISRSRCD